MSILTPLGFLGLIAIVALIVIYLLKPNYQQKVISSTYVWKLSLKYKKKRVPISRLRNILLLICQLLILVSCALILAQPFIAAEKSENQPEAIAIIDASANMRAAYNGETRFERAVEEVRQLAADLAQRNGRISVIIADEAPYYLDQRSGADLIETVNTHLDELVDLNAGVNDRTLKCSYTSGDIDAAIELAEIVLNENNNAEVVFYTATEYINTGSVRVVSVAVEGEWNAAVLNASSVLEENYYSFTAEVACYNRNTDLWLICEVNGINGTDSSLTMKMNVRCSDNEAVTVTFNTQNSEKPVYSFESAFIHFEEDDSFPEDNSFYLYDGEKPTIKIQYYSSKPNNFFYGMMTALKENYRSVWSITIKEVPQGGTPELSGYDFYIFEHEMPSELPTDGVVLLVDPNSSPAGSGITLGGTVSGDFTFAPGEEHDITRYLDALTISVTKYTRITSYTDDYIPLIYCGGEPVFLVKDEPLSKVAVLSFSVNNSTHAVLPAFPIMLANMFEYFFPVTVESHAFEVGDTVTLNSRGTSLIVSGPSGTFTAESFPYEYRLTVPGAYTLSQTPLSGQVVIERIFVKIPAIESNIAREEDVLINPSYEEKKAVVDKDLLVYLAAALVALLFIEWFLHSREQM